MPKILSTMTQTILKLSHPLYEPAFDPEFIQRAEHVWQGKVSAEFKSDAEKHVFLSQLKGKDIQYIVFCGENTKNAYEQLKDNGRYTVLYFDPQLVEADTLSSLRTVIQNQKQEIFWVSQDGVGDNGIPLFAIDCYERLKEADMHCLSLPSKDAALFKIPGAVEEYFDVCVENLTKFLQACEEKYKKFRSGMPAIASSAQFVLAIEWVFQLILQDLQQIEKTSNINLQLLTMFEQAAANYCKEMTTKAADKALNIIQALTTLQSQEVLLKQLSLFRHYLEVVNCYLGESSQPKKMLTDALVGKLKAFLLELPLWRVQPLIKKALSKSDRDAKFNHEVISQEYETHGNKWLSEGNYSEAKRWLIMAYVLTERGDTVDRLWEKLTIEVFSKTKDESASNKGTQGRNLSDELEVLSLSSDSNQREKLKSSGFDAKKQRRLAGKLFSLYCAMFVESGMPIGNMQTVKGKSEMFKSFVLLDKAKLAFQHLGSYWKQLPKKAALLTCKKDRALEALEDLRASACQLESEARGYLYQELQTINMPAECLELFLPAALGHQTSFYNTMPASSSSAPTPQK